MKIKKIEAMNEKYVKYDITTLKNHNFVANDIVIHNSNASYLYFEDKIHVRSRNNYKRKGNSTWWRALTAQMERFCREYPGYTLWGEVVNVQGGFNYGRVNGEVEFYAFDILDNNGTYLNPLHFTELCQQYNIPTVPCKAISFPFKLDSVLRMAEEDSAIGGTPNNLSEGIVIKPMTNSYHPKIGRKFLKLVSNRYYEST